MTFDYDVLVCGAGPVGLMLSIDLARRGVHVGIIEKSENPFAGSRGKGIQPRTQEILEQLGLLDEFRAVAGTYPPFRIYKADGMREEAYAPHIEPTHDTPYPNVMMLPQAMTEEILRKRIRELAVPLRNGAALIDVEQDDEGVTALVTTQGGNIRLRARYLVGADGGHSAVRRRVGIRLEGETVPMRAIIGDVRIDGLATDVWHRWPEAPGGQLLLCPLLGSNLFQMVAQIAFEGDADLSTDAISELIRARVAPDSVQIGDISWRSLLRINLRLADRYRVGRIFIAGDAAHVHPPSGGQGLNTGVQDAYNLGWKLSAVVHGADAALLDSYESERRPVANSMLVLSGRLFNAWQDERRIERGKVTDQLGVNYRGSSLCGPPRTEHAPLQPGDRAPDAQLCDARMHTVRLHELIRHPGFTLLGHTVDPTWLASLAEGTSVRICAVVAPDRTHAVGERLIDTWNALRDRYGLHEGESVLIRPDGYVARFFGPGEASECRAVLTGLPAVQRDFQTGTRFPV